jgi:hypothetical protein
LQQSHVDEMGQKQLKGSRMGLERHHQHPSTAGNETRGERETGSLKAGNMKADKEAVGEKSHHSWF